MPKNTKKKPLLAPDKKRTQLITVKATPMQKTRIASTAQRCAMSVSSFLLSLGCGFKPKARLSEDEAAMLATLIDVRADVINFSNALHAMPVEERKRMFRQYSFVLEWLKRLSVMEKRITLFLDKVNAPNVVLK